MFASFRRSNNGLGMNSRQFLFRKKIFVPDRKPWYGRADHPVLVRKNIPTFIREVSGCIPPVLRHSDDERTAISHQRLVNYRIDNYTFNFFIDGRLYIYRHHPVPVNIKHIHDFPHLLNGCYRYHLLRPPPLF